MTKVSTEIERTWICKNFNEDIFENVKSFFMKRYVTQFYTVFDPETNKQVRYRRVQDNTNETPTRYYKTVKKGTGISRIEIEEEISEKDYLEAHKKRIGTVIRKKRYTGYAMGRKIELDIFLEPKSVWNLHKLEIEFDYQSVADRFGIDQVEVLRKLGTWEEVTGDVHHSNVTIALESIGDTKMEVM